MVQLPAFLYFLLSSSSFQVWVAASDRLPITWISDEMVVFSLGDFLEGDEDFSRFECRHLEAGGPRSKPS